MEPHLYENDDYELISNVLINKRNSRVFVLEDIEKYDEGKLSILHDKVMLNGREVEVLFDIDCDRIEYLSDDDIDEVIGDMRIPHILRVNIQKLVKFIVERSLLHANVAVLI